MAESKLDTKWWVNIIIQIVVYVVAVMVAYGTLDKRVTILETKQERKVDGEELQKQLKKWKDEIVLEVKEAIKEVK